MTGQELVREVAAEFGETEISDELASHLLWSETCYPFAVSNDLDKNIEHWRKQLREIFAARNARSQS